jgi:hypothetical protein
MCEVCGHPVLPRRLRVLPFIVARKRSRSTRVFVLLVVIRGDMYKACSGVDGGMSLVLVYDPYSMFSWRSREARLTICRTTGYSPSLLQHSKSSFDVFSSGLLNGGKVLGPNIIRMTNCLHKCWPVWINTIC